MSQISVISKLTGVETTTEGTQVTLSHSSIVELHVERADVSHFARSGNDLVVTLHSGEVITLKNFYVTDAEGVSQLAPKRVTVRCGGLKILPGLLPTNLSPPRTYYWRPQAVIPVAQPSGHGYWWSCCRRRDRCRGKQRRRRGGDDDDDNTNPGTPGNPSDPDTTPPNAPSSLQFSSDGKTVTGTAEPGSTITLKDMNGM